MKKIRIIPRLDVKGPNVVKGIQLEGLRVVGNPAELAREYYDQGADELLYIDIVASLYGRNNLAHIVEETTQKGVFIPITVGGGIRSLKDIDQLLRRGADKVAINTAAIKNPELLREAAQVFGSSTIVLSVEAKKVGDEKWEAYTDNGREKTGRDVLEWVKEAEKLGVGEILITSVDHEGMREGYDLELIEKVSQLVSVPIVVSGGAGQIDHIKECMANEKVNGVAIASLLHYNEETILSIKESLSKEYPSKIQHHEAKVSTSHKLFNDVIISIVDYNLGNLCSVTNTFEQLGASVKLVNTVEEIRSAQYLVLPGVGAFAEGMKHLKEKNLDRAILEYAGTGRPLLGICLGMQLLMTKSYEFGEHDGLNLIEGEVLPFQKDQGHGEEFKIPHVGWNSLRTMKSWDQTIFDGLNESEDAYFVHSYYVKPNSDKHVLAQSNYCGIGFCSAVSKDNVYGCQFHPEKSGQLGLSILKEFIKTGQRSEVINAG